MPIDIHHVCTGLGRGQWLDNIGAQADCSLSDVGSKNQQSVIFFQGCRKKYFQHLLKQIKKSMEYSSHLERNKGCCSLKSTLSRSYSAFTEFRKYSVSDQNKCKEGTRTAWMYRIFTVSKIKRLFLFTEERLVFSHDVKWAPLPTTHCNIKAT